MLQSFRTGIDALGPENVRGALPEVLLDLVKEGPRALVDPAAAQVLMETLAGTGSENLSLPDSLLNSLNLALTGALSDLFTLLWVAVAFTSPASHQVPLPFWEGLSGFKKNRRPAGPLGIFLASVLLCQLAPFVVLQSATSTDRSDVRLSLSTVLIEVGITVAVHGELSSLNLLKESEPSD